MKVATAMPSATSENVMRGIGFMLIAILLFNCLNAAGKFLSADHSILQIVWARYLGSFAFMLAFFLPTHGLSLLRPKRPGAQILRGFFNLASSFLFFSGVALLPLSTAATISFTGPLVITALSVPFLGEPVGVRRWAAVFVGFLGAMIVIRPGQGEFDWAILFLVGSMLSSACYQLMTRKLSAADDPATAATITTVVGTAVLTLLIPFNWITPDTLLEIGLFFIMGLLGGLGHYLLTVAYKLGPAATIAPFNYTHLIWATLLGYVIFGDFPDVWTFVGATVIISAGLYVLHRERVRSRTAEPATGSAAAAGSAMEVRTGQVERR